MNTTDLKQIDALLQKRLKSFATKADLKTELAKYATKADLKHELENFATKDDLKNGLSKLKRELIVHIEEGEIAIINGVDKYALKRLEALEDRVEKVEHQLQQV